MPMSFTVFTCLLFITSTQAQSCTNFCQNDGTVTGSATDSSCGCSCAAGFSGQSCEICSGANCPCVGAWSVCDANCQRTYTVSAPKTGNGFECNYIHDEQECCTGGSCPSTWKLTISKNLGKKPLLPITASVGVVVIQETGNPAADATCTANYATTALCNAESTCVWVEPAKDATPTCTSSIVNSDGTGCEAGCSSGKRVGNSCEG